ncbi:hypothetical protein Y032_0460g1852 [Ancylostoma ceylanicum]|uniref:Uncharacterized protein n=1 Tax=Ancylostoma ceylanicum TaxID=53326 RepID=A0A016WXC3_9BILA|nr:hypothetical protein Y032_0460g1852 [Ancylostoma ceylanicum]
MLDYTCTPTLPGATLSRSADVATAVSSQVGGYLLCSTYCCDCHNKRFPSEVGNPVSAAFEILPWLMALQLERQSKEGSLPTELEIGREPRDPLITDGYQAVCLQDPCQIRPSTRLRRLMNYTK